MGNNMSLRLSFVLIIFFYITIGLSVKDENLKIVSMENNVLPNGDYRYRYSLDNGDFVRVQGILKEVNGAKVYEVHGTYSYTGPDGKIYTYMYIADENGYRIVPAAYDQAVYTFSPKAVAGILG